MINVLIVDDHDLVRSGISRMLADEKGIHVVAEAGSGEEACTLSRELHPDIVLMDVKMPGIGGLEATRKLLRMSPDTKVIALTVCEEEPFPSRLLEAGASGYLTKGIALNDMVHAIKAVHCGQRYICPDIAQKLALKKVSNEGESPFESLSGRELQVAMMIVNCGRSSDISDQLCLSPKTVNTYKHRVFVKLQVKTDVELTMLAIRHGIVDVL